ncbi:embryonic polarity protein dorsal-like [Diachasmimorpha longicaudata]|uniref:embryonic polarity protein dorsal-like n=1 Tax=Diachasmimorpha longicaudata TaxID=58733 RepID=UPI0030B8D64C
MDDQETPYIVVLEQPASKEYRFRYECERRSHGSLLGANSTVYKKTFPKIRVVGLKTEAYLIVSCVTKDPPYKVHPHRLITRGIGKSHGVLVIPINPIQNEIELRRLGIQCIRKKDIKQSLEYRKYVEVDPFQQGYDHGNLPGMVDLNVVRLCFQVFFFDAIAQKYIKKSTPVVSDPIYDKPPMINLGILQVDTGVEAIAGVTSLVISAQKIITDDVKVRFFEVRANQVVWEAMEDPVPRKNDHNQMSITVNIPVYPFTSTHDRVKLRIQLVKPLTNESGKAIPFTLFPPTNTPVDRSLTQKHSDTDDFESSQIPVCHQVEARNEQECPNSECLEDTTLNIPQSERENIHYNQNLNIQGSANHNVKQADNPVIPQFIALPDTLLSNPLYSPVIITSHIAPVTTNQLLFDCQRYPASLATSNQLYPLIPGLTPYVYPYPVYETLPSTSEDSPDCSPFSWERISYTRL